MNSLNLKNVFSKKKIFCKNTSFKKKFHDDLFFLLRPTPPMKCFSLKFAKNNVVDSDVSCSFLQQFLIQ